MFQPSTPSCRYGHHSLATPLLLPLQEGVGSESLHYWLVGLTTLTQV